MQKHLSPAHHSTALERPPTVSSCSEKEAGNGGSHLSYST